jgi:hypothetical protein
MKSGLYIFHGFSATALAAENAKLLAAQTTKDSKENFFSNSIQNICLI